MNDKKSEFYTFLENVTFNIDEFNLDENILVKKAPNDALNYYDREIVRGGLCFDKPTHILIFSNIEENQRLGPFPFAEKLENIIFSIQLFMNNVVGASGFITKKFDDEIRTNPFIAPNINFLKRFEFARLELEKFDDANIKKLIEIYKFISSIEELSWRIALQRFYYSYGDRSIFDNIMDLIIAFEALFNIPTEMSFRLSLYLAFLTEDNGKQRQEIFKFLKNLYLIRNKIVHGENLIESTVPPKENCKKLKKKYNEVGKPWQKVDINKLRNIFKKAFIRIFELSCKNKEDLEKKINNKIFG